MLAWVGLVLVCAPAVTPDDSLPNATAEMLSRINTSRLPFQHAPEPEEDEMGGGPEVLSKLPISASRSGA
jgi:hypothetical protein